MRKTAARAPAAAAPTARARRAAGNSEYNYMVMKHSMISRACRAVLAELEPDLPEVIFSQTDWTAESLGRAYCAAVCTEGEKEEL